MRWLENTFKSVTKDVTDFVNNPVGTIGDTVNKFVNDPLGTAQDFIGSPYGLAQTPQYHFVDSFFNEKNTLRQLVDDFTGAAAQRELVEEQRKAQKKQAAANRQHGQTMHGIQSEQQANAEKEAAAQRLDNMGEIIRGEQSLRTAVSSTGSRGGSVDAKIGREVSRDMNRIDRGFRATVDDIALKRQSADAALEMSEAGYEYTNTMADANWQYMKDSMAYSYVTGLANMVSTGFRLGSAVGGLV